MLFTSTLKQEIIKKMFLLHIVDFLQIHAFIIRIHKQPRGILQDDLQYQLFLFKNNTLYKSKSNMLFS